MKPKHKRLMLILSALGCCSTGIWVISQILRSSLVYYMTPSEVIQKTPHRTVRLGGLVVYQSLTQTGQSSRFQVSDGIQTLSVHYQGSLPTLFREGQGVVAEGLWAPPVFHAHRLLVKHDASYRPPGASVKS